MFCLIFVISFLTTTLLFKFLFRVLFFCWHPARDALLLIQIIFNLFSHNVTCYRVHTEKVLHPLVLLSHLKSIQMTTTPILLEREERVLVRALPAHMVCNFFANSSMSSSVLVSDVGGCLHLNPKSLSSFRGRHKDFSTRDMHAHT